MRIYVETNFVLEVALQQEQHAACEDILRICEDGLAQLFIPAFSMVEPYQTLDRRHKHRKRMKEALDNELRQLARTTRYTQRLGGFQNLSSLLIDSADEEIQRFEETRLRLLRIGTIIPLETAIFSTATQSQQQYDLPPTDALIYAAVLLHLKQRPGVASCFLNRNTKDFEEPDLMAELAQHNCKLLPRFDAGHDFIRNSISKTNEKS